MEALGRDLGFGSGIWVTLGRDLAMGWYLDYTGVVSGFGSGVVFGSGVLFGVMVCSCSYFTHVHIFVMPNKQL